MQRTQKQSLPRKKRFALRPALFGIMGLSMTAAQVLAAPVTTPTTSAASPLRAAADNSPFLALEPIYSFRDAYPITQPGAWGHVGHALLGVANPRVSQGGIFQVDIRFYNDGGEANSYYNVDWNPFFPPPGRLALYDSQKRYVCDLMSKMSGSSFPPRAADWTTIQASGYVGKILQVTFPYAVYVRIPPGEYYLQVIYLPCAAEPFSEGHSFNRNDPRELFRSNALKITVVDQAVSNLFKLNDAP